MKMNAQFYKKYFVNKYLNYEAINLYCYHLEYITLLVYKFWLGLIYIYLQYVDYIIM
jgi:hypothetical protein